MSGEGEQKAVLLVVAAELADEVALLMAAVLSLNGYKHNNPSVIDWPVKSEYL